MDDLPFVARLATAKAGESLLATLGTALATAVLAGTIALIGSFDSAVADLERLPIGRQITVESAYRRLGEGEAATPLANKADRGLRFSLSDSTEILAEAPEIETAYFARGMRFSTAAGSAFMPQGGLAGGTLGGPAISPSGGGGGIVMGQGGGGGAEGVGMGGPPPEILIVEERSATETGAGPQAPRTRPSQSPSIAEKVEEALIERVPGMMVSPSFFTAMGIKATRGLLFDDRDTEAGSQSVVLGATLAKNIFAPTPGPSSAEGPTGTANATAQGGPSGAADPVLGKRVRLNGVVYRVSAVLEPYPSEEGLSISYDEMAFVPNRTLTARTAGGQILVTGQADSISFAAREGADLARAMTSLEAAFVRRYGEGSVRVSARIVDLKRDADRRTKILFLLAILAAASGIAAAVNMYNLMSGRVARRSRDIAIQRAIGASSSRIARQTLLESGIVSGLGALIGALASFPVASALGALVSSGGGGAIHVGARPDIVAATAAGAAVAALLFSLPPAISAGATNIVDALRDE